MNTKNNQRTRLTKMLFRNAMAELLEAKKSIEKITIKELCETAELNRSTFYVYYNEPKDLLKEIEDDITASTIRHLQKEFADDYADPKKIILSFLHYIRNNDKQIRTFLVNDLDPEFRNTYFSESLRFIRDINISFPDSIATYVYAYILNGSAGIIVQWIRSDYSADENDVADLLLSLNSNAILNLNI